MTVFLFLISLAALAGIAVIIGRHLPDLAIIQVETIAKERESHVRGEILTRRLQEQWKERWEKARTKLGPLFRAAKQWFHELHARAKELESRYRHDATPQKSPAEAITEFLTKASTAAARGDTREAEAAFIEVVSLDPRNAEAYRGLGVLYSEARDYAHARETYEFLAKLAPSETDILLRLQEIAVLQGDHAAAFGYIRRAAELHPQNPKILDILLDMSILVGNSAEARAAWERLRESNPENQKLGELKERIEKMPL
ncbi:MAG: tetratricopeptide repeat protein [Patescibacteria group bacterium]